MPVPQQSFLTSGLVVSAHPDSIFVPCPGPKSFVPAALGSSSSKLSRGPRVSAGDTASGGGAKGVFRSPQNTLLVPLKLFLCSFSSAFLFCLKTFLVLPWWDAMYCMFGGETGGSLVSTGQFLFIAIGHYLQVLQC